MTFETRSGQPPSIAASTDLRHLRRLSSPSEPAPAELPFPDAPSSELVEGPRIPLRHGSAPTEVWITRKLWRRTDGLPEDRWHYQNRWRNVEDWTDPDCLSGKWARIINPFGYGAEGVLSLVDEQSDELLLTTSDGNEHPFLHPAHVEVLQDSVHLNAFEQAIAAGARG
jgi:hypothetical protein